MSETDDRYYYTVELVNVAKGWDRHIEQHEADDMAEVQEVLDSLEAENRLEWPNEIRLRRTRRLTAPLTVEEMQELEDFVAGSTDDDSDTLTDEEVDEELRDMREELSGMADDRLDELDRLREEAGE